MTDILPGWSQREELMIVDGTYLHKHIATQDTWIYHKNPQHCFKVFLSIGDEFVSGLAVLILPVYYRWLGVFMSNFFYISFISHSIPTSKESKGTGISDPSARRPSSECRSLKSWSASLRRPSFFFWKSRWFPQWCSRDVLIISNPEIPSLLVLLGYSAMLRCILMRAPFQREAMWVSSRACAMERGWRAALFRNSLQEPLYMKAKPYTVTHSARGFAPSPGSSFLLFIDVPTFSAFS